MVIADFKKMKAITQIISRTLETVMQFITAGLFAKLQLL